MSPPLRKQIRAEQVHRELLPGQSIELLQALHILTRDGQLNADSRRKLKQVNHLARLLEPAVTDILSRFGNPVIVDCGAGKSYLGFILSQLFLAKADKGEILALESRAELAERGQALADKLHFSHLKFLHTEIETAKIPDRIHLVTALHACDTASDEAIFLALRHGADHVAIVPCCQAEVAQQLQHSTFNARFAPLFAHAWHRREFGSHLTNVIRALVLEAHGYKVTVTELTGWEHAVKNELLLGKKVRTASPEARAQLEALLGETGVQPKLIRLIAALPTLSAGKGNVLREGM
jgi:hypothetical protein